VVLAGRYKDPLSQDPLIVAVLPRSDRWSPRLSARNALRHAPQVGAPTCFAKTGYFPRPIIAIHGRRKTGFWTAQRRPPPSPAMTRLGRRSINRPSWCPLASFAVGRSSRRGEHRERPQ